MKTIFIIIAVLAITFVVNTENVSAQYPDNNFYAQAVSITDSSVTSVEFILQRRGVEGIYMAYSKWVTLIDDWHSKNLPTGIYRLWARDASLNDSHQGWKLLTFTMSSVEKNQYKTFSIPL